MSLLLLLFPYRSSAGSHGKPPKVVAGTKAGPTGTASTTKPVIRQGS